ncbi:MAG: DNA-processing protein DprA [Pseudomonadota bacterium]
MTDERETLRYWLALLHAPGIGPVRFQELLQSAGDPATLFHVPPATLPEPLRAYLRKPDEAAVERDLAWAAEPDCHIIPLHDERYPPQLKVLHDAPPLLFLRGDPGQLHNPQLAIVGSRNPSVVGRETAHDFARTLAAAGLNITSGLAQGIDTASHEGALDGGGQTLAVFGTGPDRVYPARNRELAHAIVEAGGALISEYPPGTEVRANNFPRRNRIISGLSLGTLVVEAALRSGSLITARYATEQGREVFAIPGSIHNPLARGCHRLIRQGAKLVETAQDILEELTPQLHAALAATEVPAEAAQEQDTSSAASEPDGDYRRLLDCLEQAPSSVDQLVQRSGLTADAVSSMLLMLELQGQVVSTAGGYALAGKRT